MRLQNLFDRFAGSQLLQDHLYGDARPGRTGLPIITFGSDTFHGCRISTSPSERWPQCTTLAVERQVSMRDPWRPPVLVWLFVAETTLLRVTRKGWMATIPQAVREERDIKPGDDVTLHPLMGGILISKATVLPQVQAEDILRGLVSSLGRAADEQGLREEEDLEPAIELMLLLEPFPDPHRTAQGFVLSDPVTFPAW
jgi:bifunctional DNA-binding transcriptional regulator/antitoxin component of YhaV-PrlF toxin-antitoxin module